MRAGGIGPERGSVLFVLFLFIDFRDSFIELG